MPNIPEFTAQGSASPNDKGIQADEVAGRRIGMYGHQLEADANQLGEVVEQHQTNMEVSHGSAIGATAYSGFTTSLNQVVRAADPNDQSAVPKWKQEVFEHWVDNFVSNFHTKGGQQWARNYTDAMRQHFTEAAISDQSTMAGIAAHQNFQTTLTGLSSAAYQDPTSLNATLSALDASLETLKQKQNPNLSSKDLAAIEDGRQQARSAIGEAAARGMIQNGDIAGARKFLGDPGTGSILSGDQISTLNERADHQEALNQERQEHLTAAQHKQAIQNLKAQAVQVETQISDKIAAGQQLTKDDFDKRDALVNSPLAGEVGEIGSINELVRQAGRPDYADAHARTNPTVSADLIGRLTLSADQPGAVTEPELVRDLKNGYLSKDDYALFHQALPKIGGDPALKAALTHLKAWQGQFRGQIAPPGSVAGGVAYNQFIHDSSLQFMQWYQQDPAHAFDIVTNATNPRSFVGSGMIKAYTKAGSTNDPMATLSAIPGYGHLAGAPGAPPTIGLDTAIAKAHASPIKAGESWTAYKARVGL